MEKRKTGMSDVKTREKASYQIQTGEKLKERYEILDVLGEGGFGITYQGYDEVLATTVVIKEFYPEGLVHRNVNTQGNSVVHTYEKSDEDAFEKGLRNFLTEARTLARFDRLDGVVSVRDFFKENGTAYIVMEYLEGMSVKQYVKKYGPIPYEIMLAKMKRIFVALDILHKHEVIHRDLSADNIMMLPDGNMKLIDFGSARQLENNRKNKTITVMFKRGYAAEEQYRAKGKQGTWTDVYGISATMYYMLSGVVPDESVERVIHDQVKPLTECKAQRIPIKICMAIEAGMAVRAEDRIQSIRELYRHLYGKALAENENIQTDIKEKPVSKENIQTDVKENSVSKEYIQTDIKENSVSNGDIQADIKEELVSNEAASDESKKLTYTRMQSQLAREIQDRTEKTRRVVLWSAIKKLRWVFLILFLCCLAGVFIWKKMSTTGLDAKSDSTTAISTQKKATGSMLPKSTEANETSLPVTTQENTLNDNKKKIMPVLVDKKYKSVEKKLKQFNQFNVTIKYVYDDWVESGKIISQSPGGGTELKVNEEIRIIVSKGKKDASKSKDESIDKNASKSKDTSKSKSASKGKDTSKSKSASKSKDTSKSKSASKGKDASKSKDASKTTKKSQKDGDKGVKIDGTLDGLFD